MWVVGASFIALTLILCALTSHSGIPRERATALVLGLVMELLTAFFDFPILPTLGLSFVVFAGLVFLGDLSLSWIKTRIVTCVGLLFIWIPVIQEFPVPAWVNPGCLAGLLSFLSLGGIYHSNLSRQWQFQMLVLFANGTLCVNLFWSRPPCLTVSSLIWTSLEVWLVLAATPGTVMTSTATVRWLEEQLMLGKMVSLDNVLCNHLRSPLDLQTFYLELQQSFCAENLEFLMHLHLVARETLLSPHHLMRLFELYIQPDGAQALNLPAELIVSTTLIFTELQSYLLKTPRSSRPSSPRTSFPHLTNFMESLGSRVSSRVGSRVGSRAASRVGSRSPSPRSSTRSIQDLTTTPVALPLPSPDITPSSQLSRWLTLPPLPSHCASIRLTPFTLPSSEDPYQQPPPPPVDPIVQAAWLALGQVRVAVYQLLWTLFYQRFLHQRLLHHRIVLARHMAFWLCYPDKTAAFWTYPDPVNMVETRLLHLLSCGWLVLGLWLDCRWIYLYVMASYGLRLLAGPRLSPNSWLIHGVLRKITLTLGLCKDKFHPAPPRRFAELLGCLICLLGFLLHFGVPHLGRCVLFTWTCISWVAGTTGFCLGSTLFYGILWCGCIPPKTSTAAQLVLTTPPRHLTVQVTD